MTRSMHRMALQFGQIHFILWTNNNWYFGQTHLTFKTPPKVLSSVQYSQAAIGVEGDPGCRGGGRGGGGGGKYAPHPII